MSYMNSPPKKSFLDEEDDFPTTKPVKKEETPFFLTEESDGPQPMGICEIVIATNDKIIDTFKSNASVAKNLGITWRVAPLTAGDIQWVHTKTGAILQVAERKTQEDLLSSLMVGQRWNLQMQQMQDLGVPRYLLLEGAPEKKVILSTIHESGHLYDLRTQVFGDKKQIMSWILEEARTFNKRSDILHAISDISNATLVHDLVSEEDAKNMKRGDFIEKFKLAFLCGVEKGVSVKPMGTSIQRVYKDVAGLIVAYRKCLSVEEAELMINKTVEIIYDIPPDAIGDFEDTAKGKMVGKAISKKIFYLFGGEELLKTAKGALERFQDTLGSYDQTLPKYEERGVSPIPEEYHSPIQPIKRAQPTETTDEFQSAKKKPKTSKKRKNEGDEEQ
jgi:hypothetical protein